MRNSDATIVCLSKDAMNNKGYFHKEIKFVMDEADRQPEGHIFVIPVLLEACEIPERLGHLHCLHYYNYPDDAYRRLLQSLKHRAEEIEKTETTVRSSRTVVESTGQLELSKQQELEATVKISDWLMAKEIWKDAVIDFKDIANEIGVDVGVIRGCIDYAARLAHLKVLETTHNSVLLVMHWGGLG